MVRILGKIGDISSKVTIWKFDYEEFMKSPLPQTFFGSPLPDIRLGAKITLKFSQDIIDDLIENSGKICEIQIQDGVARSVKFFKTEDQLKQEYDERKRKEHGLEC